MENFLGYTSEQFKKEVINQGYVIEEIQFLNEPPGIERVVRVKEISPKRIHILIAYEKQLVISE